MSDIGPGDFVECVRRPREHPAAPWVFPPTVGSVWVVDAVGPGVAGGRPVRVGGVCLVGDGLPPRCDLSGRRVGWPMPCFRPIYRPDASLIESLKRDARTPMESPV